MMDLTLSALTKNGSRKTAKSLSWRKPSLCAISPWQLYQLSVTVTITQSQETKSWLELFSCLWVLCSSHKSWDLSLRLSNLTTKGWEVMTKVATSTAGWPFLLGLRKSLWQKFWSTVLTNTFPTTGRMIGYPLSQKTTSSSTNVQE